MVHQFQLGVLPVEGKSRKFSRIAGRHCRGHTSSGEFAELALLREIREELGHIRIVLLIEICGSELVSLQER